MKVSKPMLIGGGAWLFCGCVIFVLTVHLLVPLQKETQAAKRRLDEQRSQIYIYYAQRQMSHQLKEQVEASRAHLQNEMTAYPWPPSDGRYLWSLGAVAEAGEQAGLRLDMFPSDHNTVACMQFQGVPMTRLPPWVPYLLIVKGRGTQEELAAFLDVCSRELPTARVRTFKLLPSEPESDQHPLVMEFGWLVPRREEAFQRLIRPTFQH